MKLRNKKTGEIRNAIDIDMYTDSVYLKVSDGEFDNETIEYHSLAELNEEWEDYDDTKDHWCVSFYGEAKRIGKYANSEDIAQCKQIGNYFETKEEAEKAVEKLKAWKRLKEQGFRFKTYRRSPQGTYDIYANWDGYMPPLSWMIDKDLDLLFGGEE